MTTILSVNPTGLFSYGISNTISLDQQGLVLLEGENKDKNACSNGAGKTSLFHATSQILFGQNPTGYSSDDIVNSILKLGYFGKVEFIDKNGTDRWRVMSVRKWKKGNKLPIEVEAEPSAIRMAGNTYSGTELYLEKLVNGVWIDERCSSLVGAGKIDSKATQAKIIDLLGFDYNQFTSIAYLIQQKGLRFIEGTHKTRLEIFSELSDISKWDIRKRKVQERILEETARKETAYATLASLNSIQLTSISEIEEAILRDTLVSLNTELIDIENKITTMSGLLIKWEQSIFDFDIQIKANTEEIRSITVDKQKVLVKLNSESQQYIETCDAIRRRPRATSIDELDNEARNLISQINIRKQDLGQLMSGSGKCQRCRTNVQESHLARERTLLALAIKELEVKLAELTVELSKRISDWERSVSIELNEETCRHEAVANVLKKLIEDIETKAYKLDSANNSIKTLRELVIKDNPQYKIDSLLNSRVLILSKRELINNKLLNIDGIRATTTDIETKKEACRNIIEVSENELKYLDVIEKLFGDKGIKAFKLDNLLNRLNAILQQHLDIITDGYVQVAVSAYREKRDGAATADIQIMVREGNKVDVPLDMYSGGEKQQIALAFIGAFWQLAAENGKGSNILCLDEIFGPLDDYNSSKVFDYLSYMRSLGTSTIMVITHNASIKHSIKFDQTWIISKCDGISTLTTGQP